MTGRAVLSQSPLVRIRVTGGAVVCLRARLCKAQPRMTGHTFDDRVAAGEGKARGLVVELHILARGLP